MVRQGGPSRGCAPCRQRKKKCDEGTPSCKRCLDAGRECSGPLKDMFMRDMTANFPDPSITPPKLPSSEPIDGFHRIPEPKPVKFRKWRNIFVIPNAASLQRNTNSVGKEFQFVHQYPPRYESELESDGNIDDDEAGLQPLSEQECHYDFSSNQVQALRANKPQALGNPSVHDPFGAFAVRASHKDQVLVHNYVDVVSMYYTYKAFPRLRDRSRISGYWVPLVHSSQPSYHSAMAVAAANQIHLLTQASDESFEYSSINDWRQKALFHGAEACRFMNKRLQSKDEPVSDTSICAVFYLILAERMAGNVDRADIHLSGLSQLIKLRGGMQELPYMVGSIINYADTVLSLERLDKPYFSLYDVSRLNPYYTPRRIRWFTTLRLRPLGPGFLHPAISRALPDELLDNIREVNGLATEFETIGQTVSDAVELGFWEHRCFAVQHELLSCNYELMLTSDPGIQDPDEVVRGLCQLTCLIFFASSVNSFSTWFSASLIRNPHPTKSSPKSKFNTQSIQLARAISLVHTTLTLPLALNTTDILEMGDFFIWVLFFAGFLARDKERMLFGKRIKHMAERMGLKRFEEVKERLETFLYREIIFDEVFRELWDEAVVGSRI